MKMTQTIGIASALLLAAGCAQEEHSVRTENTNSPNYGSYPLPSGYDAQIKSSAGDAYSSGISQNSPSRSDNSIVARVRETLQRDPEIAFVVSNIQISANNGAVLLNGSVQSEEQRRQIMSKALQVPGVLAVNNQLSVMSGPNGAQGAGGSQLIPTGNSGSDHLYKDAANGPDNSTNNVLNPTSRENENSQIYPVNPGEKAQDQNTNRMNNQQMP